MSVLLRSFGRLLPFGALLVACGSSGDDAQGTMTSATTQVGTSGAAGSGASAPTAAAGRGAVAAAGSGATNSPAAGSSATAASGGETAAGSGAATAASGAAGSGAAAASGSAGSDASSSADSGATSAAGSGATSAAGSGSLPPPPTPDPLTFTRCGTFECAELKVPLDYAAPSGEQITIAVQRRAATGGAGQRIGSLLINPGGPGGSGLEFLPGFAQAVGPAVAQRFDIVAFDPRGVGESSPLDCHSTLQKLAAVDPSPDTEEEWTAADAAAKVFADECAQKHAKLLPHVGTPNVARDMDQLRAALGDEKLTYVGFSYGTSIGAHYAELFPQNVRALVLDGALDMSLGALDISLEQAVGFEESLQAYFAWCSAAANNCTWTNGSAPAEAFEQLSDKIDGMPIMTGADRPLGPGEFMFGVITPLYSGEDGYRALSSALAAAQRGDGATLLDFTDSYLNRRPDGTYGNIQEANYAVNCVDLPSPDVMGVRAETARFEMAAPTFGLSILTGSLVCSHWPVQTQPRMSAFRGAGAAPILVVGTTGDPATPYAWAEALASQLETGVLLTYEGEGHTAYLRSGACIDNAVEAYLIEGKVPEAGTRCGASGSAAPLTLPVSMTYGPRTAPRQIFPRAR